MTVGELMAELEKQDPSARVEVDGCDCTGDAAAVYAIPVGEEGPHGTHLHACVLISRVKKCPHGFWKEYLCDACDDGSVSAP